MALLQRKRPRPLSGHSNHQGVFLFPSFEQSRRPRWAWGVTKRQQNYVDESQTQVPAPRIIGQGTAIQQFTRSQPLRVVGRTTRISPSACRIG
ncbi:uncharacterized protein BDCG_16411 [Blastomyces dermatitidis ER-3]|uniref:Uncharacterized protein n=1 Tax=Ajellomyces dermatitidis (strain ER-3 / ATCC MYA-2586) TaxID=559297 RepID=A0ABX2VT18_AJEDR|nr:uncharacterized protein BDCG_16411 [Blastomyces dermatitidis ER-3]OAT00001.1 hypothetical protein BDCG_16411 [Blastomyces dermatitidis ER-3]